MIPMNSFGYSNREYYHNVFGSLVSEYRISDIYIQFINMKEQQFIIMAVNKSICVCNRIFWVCL